MTIVLETYGPDITSALIQVADHMRHSKLTEETVRDVAELNGVEVVDLAEAILDTLGEVRS